MESAWLVAVALALGAVIGAAVVLTVGAAARQGRRVAALTAPSLPAGLQEVVDALDRPAVLVDSSLSPVRASPPALESGLIVASLLHPEVAEIAREVRSSGEVVERELEVPRGRREPARHLRVRATPIATLWVLIVAEDLTDAIRLEEVRRDFVANVSHELKTPIGAVGLLAEAIGSASDDPEQVRRFTSRLTTEAQRLAQLTQGIIDLSRIQGAEPIAAVDRVGVDSIVAAAIDGVRVVADAKGIDVVAGGSRGLELIGSETMLVTAVHNLVANAVQHSPDGSRIGVGVTLRDDLVEIAVTDQGVGIDEAEQERVFERFFRGDPARSRGTGGTGLGLAIVKHVVQNHGGEVRLWSRLGRGSTFTIALPLAPPADEGSPEEGNAA